MLVTSLLGFSRPEMPASNAFAPGSAEMRPVATTLDRAKASLSFTIAIIISGASAGIS